MKVRVAQGSLTDGDETLLVNASNTNVTLGSGVSAAIRKACGPDYQEHIARALQETYGGPMAPGEVLVTDAGTHPRAKWVAHAAVMDYREGASGSSLPTLDTIRACCTNLVQAIDALPEPVTVAWVALGAGVGQLGVREPTRIACETLLAHPSERILGVTFYGFGRDEHDAIAEVVARSFPLGG